MLFSPLFEFGFLFMEHSKVLVQDFALRSILAEEIDLMLKSFTGKCLSFAIFGLLLLEYSVIGF